MTNKITMSMNLGLSFACLFTVVVCDRIGERRLRENSYFHPKSKSLFLSKQRYLPSENDSEDYDDDHFYSLSYSYSNSYSYSYNYISEPSITKDLLETPPPTKTKFPPVKPTKDPPISLTVQPTDSPTVRATDFPTENPVRSKGIKVPPTTKISCDSELENVGSSGIKEMPISFYYDVQTIDDNMNWIDSLQNKILQALAGDVLKCEEGVVLLDDSGNKRFLQNDSNILSIGSMPYDEPTGDECDTTNASAEFCTRMIGHITVTYTGSGETIEENILALVQDDMATSKYTGDDIPEIVQIDFLDTATDSTKMELQAKNSSSKLIFSFVGAGVTLAALFLLRFRNKPRGDYEEDRFIIEHDEI